MDTGPWILNLSNLFSCLFPLCIVQVAGVGVEIFPPKVDGDEVKRVQAHNMLIQTKTDLVKAKNAELDDANWSPYSQSMSICQILGFPDFLVTI